MTLRERAAWLFSSDRQRAAAALLDMARSTRQINLQVRAFNSLERRMQATRLDQLTPAQRGTIQDAYANARSAIERVLENRAVIDRGVSDATERAFAENRISADEAFYTNEGLGSLAERPAYWLVVGGLAVAAIVALFLAAPIVAAILASAALVSAAAVALEQFGQALGTAPIPPGYQPNPTAPIGSTVLSLGTLAALALGAFVLFRKRGAA